MKTKIDPNVFKEKLKSPVVKSILCFLICYACSFVVVLTLFGINGTIFLGVAVLLVIIVLFALIGFYYLLEALGWNDI